MNLNYFPVGALQVNCIVFATQTHCYIVDPGDSPDLVLSTLKQMQLPANCQYKILLTHGHFDHIGAVGALKKALNASVHLHVDDHLLYASPLNAMPPWFGPIKDLPAVEPLESTDDFQIIHTPGHTQGSVGIYIPQWKVLLSGDTLFREGIGRTDFPGGNSQQLFDSIQKKLFLLDDNVEVYPGHGDLTNIGHEKRHNPYLNHSPF